MDAENTQKFMDLLQDNLTLQKAIKETDMQDDKAVTNLLRFLKGFAIKKGIRIYS
jgi:hypothetical protein